MVNWFINCETYSVVFVRLHAHVSCTHFYSFNHIVSYSVTVSLACKRLDTQWRRKVKKLGGLKLFGGLGMYTVCL